MLTMVQFWAVAAAAIGLQAEDVTIAFDDPELAIPWPLPIAARSSRDRAAPALADLVLD